MSDYLIRNKWWRSVRNLGLACAVCGLPAIPANAQSRTGQDDLFVPPAGNRSEQSDGTEMDGNVDVSGYMTVDLHVQDTDLADVLKMLSMQSQKNIVVSKNVAATVTADLYDVTFYEALDAILNANGYGYREKGNFIYIYTTDELKQIEDAERKVIPKRFELSYLNASDAAVFVTPLLSDEGSIAINGEVAAGIDPDTGDVGGTSWANSATIVITDYPENVEQIEKMLRELDTRPQQVLVEATVLQTKLTEDNAWGIDFSIVADMNFADVTNPLSPVTDLLDGADGFQPEDNNGFASQTNIGRVAGPGSLKIGVVSDDISVFLRVLDEVSDTTVLSRPKVLALNRQRGEILIGAQIGYLNTTATETSTTQTVEFLDTGTKLLFRPFIAKDGFIRLELAPSVSEGLIREVTTSGGDAVTIPDRITQELTTNVVVRNGNTVVLGGLFREDTTLTRTQIPVLGDIPLFGPAFQGKSDTTERQEIIFLITPTVMKDEYLDQLGREGAEGVRRARLAARKGVLWWSNDRLTAQHNMRAQDFMRQGNNEMALWEIERSLSLRANQPEVIRMKEEITGLHDRWFDRAIIKTMVDRAIDDHLTQSFSEYNKPDQEVRSVLRKADLENLKWAESSTQLRPGREREEALAEALADDGQQQAVYEVSDFENETETATADEEPEIGSLQLNDESEDYYWFDQDGAADTETETATADDEPLIGSTIGEGEESQMDYLAGDFGFRFDPEGDVESSTVPTLDSVSHEIASGGKPVTHEVEPFSFTFVWNRFQRVINVGQDSPELAEVPTDKPETVK